ncbi:hypothetical protein CYMTET_22605 [Cymbomonas tetramitiformis]|uniref:Uncharacterized protein n=1 Tax=Cymbomonas tetramitiformis TaxID=36881 RepID=A0AAE0L1R4_9CHLO|nr:hypothetical protein CYMTET_22605 [Cymbomonas tetramitiformis]
MNTELVEFKEFWCAWATAREGLKEAGYVDPSTDQPVSAEAGRRAAGAKGKSEEDVVAGLKKVAEEEDPTSPLDLELSSSDEEEGEYPPVSEPKVTGKLTQLNGLWWAETPDLWLDAMVTVERMAALPAMAGVQTRAQSEQRPAEKQQPAAVQQQPTPRMQPGEPLVDNQDWKLIPSEFSRLQAKYAKVLGGRFQVDACCDLMGQNRQVDTFWTDCLKEQWRGRVVWCNPPFSDSKVSIADILRHYASEARHAPQSTAALFLLPDFPQADWRPLLREYGMEIAETIPRVNEQGEPNRMFVSPGEERGHRTALQELPIPWPVLVVLAKPQRKHLKRSQLQGKDPQHHQQ